MRISFLIASGSTHSNYGALSQSGLWEWPHLTLYQNSAQSSSDQVSPPSWQPLVPAVPGNIPEKLSKGTCLLHPFLQVRASPSTSHQSRDPELQKGAGLTLDEGSAQGMPSGRPAEGLRHPEVICR